MTRLLHIFLDAFDADYVTACHPSFFADAERQGALCRLESMLFLLAVPRLWRKKFFHVVISMPFKIIARI